MPTTKRTNSSFKEKEVTNGLVVVIEFVKRFQERIQGYQQSKEGEGNGKIGFFVQVSSIQMFTKVSPQKNSDAYL